MSEFYLKYFDLLENTETNEILKCIDIDEDTNQCNLMSTKENIETLANTSSNILNTTRSAIFRYLYFVWLEGVSGGPAEWWCEMLPEIKRLVIIGTCLESLTRDLSNAHPKNMEISQVLLKLWDYIKTQEKNNSWSYIMDEYDDLCRKHNDLRELYFL